MASCERCWADAFGMSFGTSKSQPEIYGELIKTRNCSAEQQAGPEAGICPKCKRKAVHQAINQCMSCGYEDKDDG